MSEARATQAANDYAAITRARADLAAPVAAADDSRQQIPYMLENTPDEFQRVRDLAWPAPADDGLGTWTAPTTVGGTWTRLNTATRLYETWSAGRPAPAAAEGADELREALGQQVLNAVLRSTNQPNSGGLALEVADALLAGPLADLIRERDALLAKVQAVEALLAEVSELPPRAQFVHLGTLRDTLDGTR